MSREDIAKLLGGYATGTLTPEEQQALFAAALEDQALFDELAREQALRDVLREPAARGQLLAALEDRPRWYRRFGSWMMRPAALTAAAACLVAGTVAIWRPWRGSEAAKPAVVATALPQEAPPIPSPPALAEQNAPPAAAPAKVKAPVTSFPSPAMALPAATGAKKELLAAESARPDTMAQRAVEPSAPSDTAMIPAPGPAPPPPPAKSASQEVMLETPSAGRDTAELMKTAPGVAQPAGDTAGKASARGALSANAPQPASAPAATSGGDARQRYYAGSGFAAEKAQTRNQQLRGAAQAFGSQVAPLGIKWSILRREANGEFATMNAEDLRAGDTVELRLASNQLCDLSVFDNVSGKLVPLLSKRVEAGETVDTPLPALPAKAERELVVELSRLGNAVGAIAKVQPAPARASQQSQIDRSEQATYTVGPAGAQQVALSITLHYR